VFTGIVREVGRVASFGGDRRDDGDRTSADGSAWRLEIEAPETAPGVAIGDSVAVGGCCLTAVGASDDRISFDVVPETLDRTSLARLTEGSRVNVEPSLRVGEPLGGHYVQGHVDAVGVVRAIERDVGVGVRVWLDAPPEVMRYVVEKGSITVDGTSLTVSALDERGFEVALVPHTLSATTLGELATGDQVNLEPDVLAKYVERLLAPAS
jgi:riboflavin synthase